MWSPLQLAAWQQLSGYEVVDCNLSGQNCAALDAWIAALGVADSATSTDARDSLSSSGIEPILVEPPSLPADEGLTETFLSLPNDTINLGLSSRPDADPDGLPPVWSSLLLAGMWGTV